MPIRFLKHIKIARKTDLHNFQKSIPQGIRHHIEGIYVFPGNDIHSRQLLFNDGYPSLIFMPVKDCKVQIVTNGKRIYLDSVWLCCGKLENTYIDIIEPLEYFLIVRFKPHSFYKLFGVSPETVHAKPVCSFEDVVGKNWESVIESIYNSKTVEEKIEKITTFLSTVDKGYEYPPLLKLTLDYIDKEKGNVSVQDLLEAAGPKINYKWLQRSFLNHIGISPKKYISLQRFIYAYDDLSENIPYNLMGTALKNGYYDHNHFLKDFKRYTGKSPSAYFNI